MSSNNQNSKQQHSSRPAPLDDQTNDNEAPQEAITKKSRATAPARDGATTAPATSMTPYERKMEDIKAVAARFNSVEDNNDNDDDDDDTPNFLIVRDMNFGQDADQEGSPESEEAYKALVNKLTQKQVDHMRGIILTKNRNKMIGIMEQAVLGHR